MSLVTRPFPLASLRRLDRHAVVRTEQLRRLLGPARGPWLEPVLGLPLAGTLVGVDRWLGRGLGRSLSSPLCALLFTLAGDGGVERQGGFIELPADLAQRLVVRALGGAGEPPAGRTQVAARPPSPAEEGILAYLGLVLIDELGLSGRLRIVGVTGDLGRVKAHVGDDELWVAELRVGLGPKPAAGLSSREAAGWRVRLFVRSGDLLAMAAARSSRPPRPAWLESLEIEVRVELGEARLWRRELAALARGDVLVMDWIDGGRREPGALVRLATGSGRRRLQARWQTSTDSELSLELLGLERVVLPAASEGAESSSARGAGETVPPGEEALVRDEQTTRGGRSPMAGAGPMAGESSSIGQALADDVEVAVIAEAGRLRLTLAELEQLGPGQVLRLGRPLDGAVELSVSGRRVARGVLVDVDGELGVRVVEIG